MIAHTHLHVSDYARSRAFYQKVLATLGYEIIMEVDAVRDDFLGKFYALIKEKIIDRPETLKPF